MPGAPLDLDAGVLGELASIVLDSPPLGLVLQRLAHIADAASSVAFPGFADLAAHHGIGSALAIVLAVAGPASAALSVYGTGPGHTDLAAMTATIRTARVFAAYAAVAVSKAAAMDAERSTSAQLGSAMASRAGIEQAKGVLMAQRAITAEAAFAVLATASQHANVKLAVIAAQIVAATEHPVPDTSVVSTGTS